MKTPMATRRKFLGTMGTVLAAAAVGGDQATEPARAPDKTGEVLFFDYEFTWKEEKPFFCWSPFAPGLNRPGLKGVKTGREEPPYEPFDPGCSSYPDNWIAPDDYWNGTWHFRYQFKQRSSERPGTIQMGIWSEMTDYWKTWKEMTSPKVPFDGKSGVFLGKDGGSPAKAWWRKERDRPVDFARVRDFNFLGFVMWTDKQKVLHPAASLGDRSGWKDRREDYFPCVLKAAIVAVPAGKTFSGWKSYSL